MTDKQSPSREALEAARTVRSQCWHTPFAECINCSALAMDAFAAQAKKTGRKEAFQEVAAHKGPLKRLKFDVKVSIDQGTKLGRHKICEMVNGICQIGGDNCERD